MEEWKDIPEYIGLYKVSSYGRIYSYLSHKYLHQALSSSGYYHVQLYKNHKAKTITVHMLVASAFLLKRSESLEVNHIDGNKSNNSVNNLEWVTKSENQKHAIATNLRVSSPMRNKTGEANHFSKTILQYGLDGNFIAEIVGISEAARKLNCNSSSISLCLSGKHKTAGGFIWRYKTSSNYPAKVEPIHLSKKTPSHRTWKQKNLRKMNRIIQRTLEGKIVKIWDNYRQIISETEYDDGNIYKVINGKSKSAYGYTWSYEE